MKSVFIYLSTVSVYFAAGALVVSSAAAQDDGSGGVYARVGGGVSFVSDWDQDITIAQRNNACLGANCNPDRQEIGFDRGFVAAAALGFDYASAGIRTELEYRYASSEFSDYRLTGDLITSVTLPPNNEVSAHFVMTNLYYDFTNASPFTPFIGGGVGAAFTKIATPQAVGRDPAFLRLGDAALAYQGRAGVSYELGGGFLADLEYVYLRTNELSFGVDIDDLDPSEPSGRNFSGDRYESSSVMVSLRKHF